MKIAIYTSFAINYLAKARVLVRTIKQRNPQIDVIGIVCDRFPSTIRVTDEEFDQIWMVEDYPAAPIRSWIFRHGIMELSTAVKGWGLTRLLDAGYDYVIYLDPDCWVLKDPAKIVDCLPSGFSVGVVPHTTRAADSDEEIRIVETSSLRHGIYNLGFLLVRNDGNGQRFARWWAARLDKYCIDDFNAGLFTDQRWFDLAVGYFDFIKIIRHNGIDVASWNVGQRALTRNGDGYLVDGDELMFYHFSGVGPTSVHRWVREKFAPADPLAAELEFSYEAMINESGQAELAKTIPYFELYSDGVSVPAIHRAVYRSHLDLVQRYKDPYDVSSVPNFREEARDLGSSASKGVVRLPSLPIRRRLRPWLISGLTQAASVPVRLRFALRVSLQGEGSLGDLDTLARRLFDQRVYQGESRSLEIDADRLWAKYSKSAWRPGVFGNRFFDPGYYRLFISAKERAEYRTPLHHYIARGVKAGLSPSWIYDDAYYLEKYSDVREAIRRGEFICGFEHFARWGAEQGRDGCEYFNERAYLTRHPDVANGVTEGRIRSGEAHYVKHGHKEKRSLRGTGIVV
jgi:hypothetical protein